MSPDARRRALLATARIACAVTLVSCGPKAAPIVDVSTPPQQPVAVVPEAPPALQVPATGRIAEHLAEHGTPSAEDVEVCEASINEQVARQDAYQQSLTPPYSDEEHAKLDAMVEAFETEENAVCCETLRSAHLSSLLSPDDRSNPNIFHGECCRILNYQGPACTPWGPPTPPEMAARVA